MPWGFAAVAGATIAGSVISSNAAKKAANSQSAAAQAGIDEQQRQYEQYQQTVAPYVNAGTSALGAQQTLLGLNGQEQQQAAINSLKASPLFTSAQKTGNEAILANGAATGNLRGGNTQAALAQFSPQLLSQIIQQQYSNLGGIASLGGNAAAGQGNAGLQTGQGISNLLQQQGAAQAGGQLGSSNAYASGIGNLAGLGTSYFGGGGPRGVQGLGGYTNFNVSPGTAPVNNQLLQDFTF